MAISSRTKEIVELLLESRDAVRIREIANRLGLSERTVYRELPTVTDLLASYQILLPGSGKKGIFLQGNEADIQRCREDICGKQRVQIVDRDRRFYGLLLYLLTQDDYIKTEAIAIDLSASLSTIRSDLREIERKFSGGSVRVVSRKGTGIRLEGTVFSKDYLFIYCLLQCVEVSVIQQWITQGPEYSNQYLSLYEKQYDMDTLRVCSQMLWEYLYVNNQRYDFELDDYNYTEIVMLLSVAADRLQRGETDYFPEVSYQQNAVLTDFCARWFRLYEKEFQIRLADASVRYVEYLFLRRLSGLSMHQMRIIQSDADRSDIARFIDRVEGTMGINLRQDTQLMEGLCVHLDKALERVRSGMSVSNPFAQETKTDYRQIFGTVQEALAEIFVNDYFPEDETAYIVLYFAAILDRITRKSFRVMVVCSGGMGSSKMLANRLEMELPEINIKKITSIVGMRQEDPSDYDLVLSTIPLVTGDVDFLKVSPLLPEEDLELVRAKIRRHRYSMLRKIDEREKQKPGGDDLKKLLDLQEAVNWSIDLISRFQVTGADFAEQLMEREELKNRRSSFMIPDTELCYCECVTDIIEDPMLFLSSSETGWHAEEIREDVKTAVFFIYPEDLTDPEFGLLKFLVGLILNDREVQKAFEQKKEERIRGLLAGQVRRYLAEQF